MTTRRTKAKAKEEAKAKARAKAKAEAKASVPALIRRFERLRLLDMDSAISVRILL
jgi:hypothetical protein